MTTKRRAGTMWVGGTLAVVAMLAALAGIAGAVVSPDGPPDYGVPKTVREKAWCADRDALRAAIEADLPQLAAGLPVDASAVAAFLSSRQSLVFAYEENAVPEAGAGPPDQIAWMHEAADGSGLQDPTPYVEGETAIVVWAAGAC